ncbi:hypothetical protein [Sanguibacter suaedae]|uniref:Uncharacterized protein n=1 Tax=Sanguibacter suaedae TaxID=2795737 RepID=A0A934M9K8_9MICO|nr:hypothetical protein [Sanguibacter suaedae]MBI9114778.1 hypothetical protein [Sanguibacter suaedae]
MRSHKPLVITVTAVVLVLAAALGAAALTGWGPFSDEPTATPAQSASPTSAAPTETDPSTPPASTADPEPTEEPTEAYTEPAEEPTSEPTSPPPGTTVDVVITFADWVPEAAAIEASAYVTTIDESGSCTLKLTSGSTTRTATIPALLDASTMSCGGILIPGSALSSGTWTAVVTYESASSSGSSAPAEVVVP